MQEVVSGVTSNVRVASRVKVISAGNGLSWVRPPDNSVFNLTDHAELPEILFEVRGHDGDDLNWSWSIEWEAKVSGLRERARKTTVLQTFKQSGSFTGGDNIWIAEFSGEVLGGRLTVVVSNGGRSIKRTIQIRGVNPSKDTVAQYIAELEDMDGFEKLLEQETNTKHFINLDGEPIAAFDKGYGITQMTNPAPSYEQVWNWKANILGGSGVYKDKVLAAKKYLGQQGRIYTEEQLQHEIFSRWNGGSYHQWDEGSEKWIRKKNILCDSATGNIGWSMSKSENQGKTEVELHERDKDKYKEGGKGQTADHAWQYSGVCYADHVLKE
ncbi:hypothetical protein [Pseudomonas putida]|uniref:hypothetical protein n=1 Tax=Pseudomonas putida TaxID=303 RepID=UPI00383A1F35